MFTPQSQNCPDPVLEQLARSLIIKCTFSDSNTRNDTRYAYAQFRGTPNEDRFAISEDWELNKHTWQFLAVFDGHGGPNTAEYLAKHFASHLRRSMDFYFSSSLESTTSTVLQSHSAANDNLVIEFTQDNVSELIKREVRGFDEELGNAIKAICPNPERLHDDTEAWMLYEAHKEVIARARCGSTMAGILIDKTEHRMWVCCVGDSSVVLSTKPSGSDRRKTNLLNKHHTGFSPQEYYRVSMEHPSREWNTIWLDGEERIFGTLSMTRAFGDFMFKFPTSFTTALFSKFPSTAMKSVERVLSYNHTPPYVIPDPFVGFVDLTTFTEDEDPILVLYTDGLEALANRLSIARNNGASDATNGNADAVPNAVDIIGALIDQPFDPTAFPSRYTNILPRNNTAFNLIYNLLNGAIPTKLRAHLEFEIKRNTFDEEELYIDDVTVIMVRP
ncbi:phosphatase 2C-like domain-containing protein [Lentinula aciculospora]|uniref:Phosphatase 2C-like domain-containing protein n=1 Tax=Lentinula aciculospora TaxID=153920 RepID=A0A9W9AL66_9AGAR|nr:phosphatase 2C-like domain-containing protein [Lentinula aciculospora]